MTPVSYPCAVLVPLNPKMFSPFSFLPNASSWSKYSESEKKEKKKKGT
jgi:hypothetical protein